MSISGVDNSFVNYDSYIREDHDLVNASIKYGNNPYGIPAIHYAIMQGDEKAVRLFLDHGASPNSQVRQNSWYEEPNTALDYAVYYGQLSILKLLLERKADIQHNSLNALNDNSLRFAVASNHIEIIKFLVKNGAIINCNDGYSPMYCAISSGAVAALKTLLELGGTLDILQKQHDLMSLAINSGEFDMVKLLLDNNIPVDTDYNSALSLALQQDKIEIAKLLIKYGAKINRSDLRDQEPWYVACSKENVAIIKLMIRAFSRGELNEKLLLAVQKGQFNVVKVLVDEGANVNYRKKTNQEPLLFSAVTNPKVFQFLVDHGANIHESFNGGTTILHEAVKFGHLDVVSTLIKAGIPINAKNIKGETPLHLGIGTKNLAVLLLDHGANLHIKDDTGWTALHRAYACCDIEILKELIKRGASLDEYTPYGTNALHCALKFHGNPVDRFDLIKFLIEEKRMDLNKEGGVSEGYYAKTPFTIAIETTRSDDFTILNYLMMKGGNMNIPVFRSVHSNTYLEKSLLGWMKRVGDARTIQWMIQHGAR